MIANNKTIKMILPYILLIILTLISLLFFTELWKFDIKVPLGQDRDGLFSLMIVKTITDHGWYLHNENLGAPFGLDLYDFPLVDGFHVVMIKIINFLFKNQDYSYVITFNLFFILGFIFASLTCYIVCRKIKLPILISIIISILYSFQPYHFFRWVNHYFLSAYYMIPISVLIMIWLINEEVFFENNYKNGFVWNKKSFLCIVLCLIIGSSGIYYSFFTCFFVLIIALINFYRKKQLASLINPLIIIGIICLSIIISLIPNFIYWAKEGKNIYIASRLPLEADIYALKIANLLLPIPGHRVSLLKWIREQYDQAFAPVQQITFGSLGIFGNIGFLFLLITPWINIINIKKYKFIIVYFSLLTYSAIFLAQPGGFGSLFNLYVSPQIRAYDRISIFIALFSLLGFGLLIDQWLKKSNIKIKIISYSLILILGLYDQIPQFIYPNSTDSGKSYSEIYADIKSRFINDKNFINKIENQVPEQAMIYQLPYLIFPESPPVAKLDSYGLLKGYLHSSSLKWSFGSINGRNQNWHKWVDSLNFNEQLTILASVGFQGIYLDRKGYAEGSQKLENELENKLNTKPIISATQDLLFYNMEKYNNLYQEKYSQLKKDLWLEPQLLEVNWDNGFYPEESSSREKWRWAYSHGTIKITNHTNELKELNLEMNLKTGWAEKSELKITSELWTENLLINNQPLLLKKRLSVPPGQHKLIFESTAKQVDAPSDNRQMFFSVSNYQLDSPDDRKRMNLLKKISRDLAESIQQPR